VNPDTYLGDGLYASFDGFQVRLYTVRVDGTHEVFLDGPTLARFQAFIVEQQRKGREQAVQP
jgi:hypothetical protein